MKKLYTLLLPAIMLLSIQSNAQPNYVLLATTKIVAFIIDTHRKVDFYNLPSKQDVFVSAAAFNTAGIGTPSQPVSIQTL